MLYSTSTQYAIRGLCELAGRAGQKSIMLEQLIAGTNLPGDYLGKIFRQLVLGGVLVSSKGRGGGFMLARPLHQIRLLDIVNAVDGSASCDQCALGLAVCTDQAPCAEHDLFKPIRQRLKDYLATTTLADLVASGRARGIYDNVKRSEQTKGPESEDEVASVPPITLRAP